MATIRPFAALLPNPSLASRVCELPYDVMSSEEARRLAEGNPLSFLHVSKPEIDLPVGTDLYSPAVYAKGLENFRRLIDKGALQPDSHPCLYLYRQIMGAHSQIGVVASASCQEYLEGIIRKHELTRIDKENDRVRHIDTLGAQTGPVFLTYRARPAIDALVARHVAESPIVDFVATDGVRHTSWRLGDPAQIGLWTEAFAEVPRLYIADGHHRSAAAARVFQERKGAGESSGFLTVLFPHHQMRILPYNRLLKDLPGHTPESLLARLGQIFEIGGCDDPAPRARHQVALFLKGKWHGLKFREALTRPARGIAGLDVSLLQDQVLGPVFGIDDPRTSQRIQFVGGIRGTGELEKRVASGEFACAFSLHPTGIEDLMSIADEGGIMPPKSTWFEPKLRDGMFCQWI